MSELTPELKSAVYLSVAKMMEEYTQELEISVSPSFVASLIELVYDQIVILGEDLELFAKHAGRNIANTSDLYMVTRRNEALTAALKTVHESLAEVARPQFLQN